MSRSHLARSLATMVTGGAPPDASDGGSPRVLVMDDPTGMAERCWDAGFTVRVRETRSGGTAFVVTDPFGRRLVLAPRAPRAKRAREESR